MLFPANRFPVLYHDKVLLNLLCSLLLVQFCLTLPAVSADKSFVFRTSSKSTYSDRLGVVTIPAYVMIDNARHPGLYVTSKPTLELGRNMKLAPGMVLLTIDGYSMTSSEVADNWLASRSNNKQIQYTFVLMQGGKPRIGTGLAQSGSAAADKKATVPGKFSVSSTQESTDELENYCLGLINNSRRSGGAPAVRRDAALSKLAQQYADYMADHAEQYELTSSRSPHIDLQGRSPADRARQAGITTAVFENIGRGSRSGFTGDKSVIGSIHQQMMSEPAGVPNHRSTIMDPQSTGIGIGIARSPNRIYLTQEFGY